MHSNSRLDWVDIAKGISIILVVMMYSAYSVGEDTGGVGFLHYVIGFATPFRMPEFFLISGLFLSRVISRDWLRYADRRVIHYLYFYALWAAIMIVVKTAIGEGAPVTALSYLAWAVVEPYGVLWFIYLLAAFSLAAKVLWDLRVPHWVVLPVAAVLQMTSIQTGSYAVDQFAEYFVYFYAGYALAPLFFRLVAWAESNAGLAIAGLIAWAGVNGALVFLPQHQLLPVHMEMGLAALPGLHLMLALAGGAAICVASALLSRFSAMNWLRWLGEHSIVIYLAFTLPMSFVRIALIRLGLVTEPNLLSLVVFATAMVAPVVLYALVARTGWGRFLFTRPRWAMLPGTARPASARAAQVPAE